ncbi:MAG: MotA/TolQ/ExbB proton channel family protein [Proteobacteria bacterium]|nr:MotA/TolQ/ExbB proton channel family protein [Pseudomonadota bacterium]
MIENTDTSTFFDLVAKGGYVMIPLLVCSIISLTIILQRLFWGPSKNRIIPLELQNQAIELIKEGKIQELMGICRANKTPLGKIIYAAVSNLSRSREQMMDTIEVIGRKEALDMEKNLATLGSIAAVSPLLGLLGTVFGMISTFKVINTHGTGNPALMAGGIAEALIATATGLTIAIPSLLFYKYFINKSKNLVTEMELVAVSLIEALQNK